MSFELSAVFDCNTLLQAMGSPDGPSGRCFDAVAKQRVQLLGSTRTLAEFSDVITRPKVLVSVHATRSRADEFFKLFKALLSVADDVQPLFDFPRDPKDAKYIDLAIATGAHLIVSRDRDLLDLMSDDDEAGRRLRDWYPAFRVMTPPAFLELLDADERK